MDEELAVFQFDGEPIVTIHPDGTVTCHKLPLEESARQAAELFWQAFSGYLKDRSEA